MKTITQLPEVVQTLLTVRADELARETGFVRRLRIVSGSLFVQTLVFGWLQYAHATRRQLHQVLVSTGTSVSGPGLDARFTAAAVEFLRAMVIEASQHVFAAAVSLPVLPRFNGVYLTDGSRLEGALGGVKVVVRLELQRGGLQVGLEPLDRHDRAGAVMDIPLPAGALHVADLGFFDLAWFEECLQQGVAFVTRLKAGTHLYDLTGQRLDLAQQLAGTRQPVSLQVLVGARRVPMTLLAERVSLDCARKRQAQLQHTARRKHRPVSPERLKLVQWTVYLTSCADLSSAQVHALYRARWQIERLFKRWKSLAKLTQSTSRDPFRQACERYAKLLAVLLAHWLTQTTVWPCPRLSLDKAFLTLQHYATLLHLALVRDPPLLEWICAQLQQAASTLTLSQRKSRPNTLDLLLNFDHLA
jgi:hypothetical protein